MRLIFLEGFVYPCLHLYSSAQGEARLLTKTANSLCDPPPLLPGPGGGTGVDPFTQASKDLLSLPRDPICTPSSISVLPSPSFYGRQVKEDFWVP